MAAVCLILNPVGMSLSLPHQNVGVIIFPHGFRLYSIPICMSLPSDMKGIARNHPSKERDEYRSRHLSIKIAATSLGW
ncbi:hypothetical protein MTR_2g033370 [Medicago truncatula]|uniref:Uncharacterized protein n=1 Tax=Medicago truncatula TaxID=3880 RepID=G7IMN9_MEDTR|nr:hypothetical protein MTR_2g033370 [Medicago truncatula]